MNSAHISGRGFRWHIERKSSWIIFYFSWSSGNVALNYGVLSCNNSRTFWAVSRKPNTSVLYTHSRKNGWEMLGYLVVREALCYDSGSPWTLWGCVNANDENVSRQLIYSAIVYARSCFFCDKIMFDSRGMPCGGAIVELNTDWNYLVSLGTFEFKMNFDYECWTGKKESLMGPGLHAYIARETIHISVQM